MLSSSAIPGSAIFCFIAFIMTFMGYCVHDIILTQSPMKTKQHESHGGTFWGHPLQHLCFQIRCSQRADLQVTNGTVLSLH